MAGQPGLVDSCSYYGRCLVWLDVDPGSPWSLSLGGDTFAGQPLVSGLSPVR